MKKDAAHARRLPEVADEEIPAVYQGQGHIRGVIGDVDGNIRPMPRHLLNAPSPNILVLPDKMIRLSVHGYHRLTSEGLLLACERCKEWFGGQSCHSPDDVFYHLTEIEGWDYEDTLDHAVRLLREALH
jgi:hypothetical protein